MAAVPDIPENLEKNLQRGWQYAHPKPGHEIAICGISGCFPESDNVHVFADNLFNKIDLITADDRRWSVRHPEIPERIGKIEHLEKFDASFFGLHYKQAHCMDPMCRMLLEKTFEAIIDAGINPLELKGTRTGVFVGVCFSESEKTWFYEKLQNHGMALTGCARAMYAQRISYWLGFKGPAYTTDTACSSSMYAIDMAYKSIQEGNCDMAIVGGCNLCLHPYVSLQFARLGVLNPDGKCKCFDEDANGYTRSEAVVVIVLQKSKDAKRIYAHLVHSKSNCDGYKEQGITYPSGEVQQVLLEEFYKECGVDPTVLGYMEAHGTGTKVGDPEEVKALDKIFCKRRKTPLLIGSVKSNIGHTEPASGLCSVTKVLIGMESGYIPPNINFKKARKEMTAIHEGKMIVVTEKTKWDGGYAGVNSFGFGGANAHILLKSNEKNKINYGIPKDDLPRLVYVSGRTQEAVETLLNDVGSRPLDAEYVRLLQESFKYNISGHLYRGVGIFNKKQLRKISTSFCENESKPIWFLFSGLGSQWTGMGTSLMKIPVFAETINKCHQILSKKGIDLLKIITTKDSKVFEDNVNITVGITAIQLGLVDLLNTIHVKPVGLIGYSIGEIACAYADNCLDLEQSILSSYYIGSSTNSQKSKTDLLNNIKKLIPNPKERSSKWMITMEDHDLAKRCSPEYIVHSLYCSFKMSKQISHDAVVIEIAPQAHLQHLLKEIVSDNIKMLALLQKDCVDNIEVFLNGIGELYLMGCNPRIEFMYPEVKFPVSRGTPMVSHLIKWDHSMDWYVTKFESQEKIKTGERTVTIVLTDEDTEFVSGHVIDGRILYPATGYLFLVWETLGMMQGCLFSDMSVVFEDIKFLRATNVPKEGRIYLVVMVQKVSGHFEVIESGQTVVTGRVRITEDPEGETIEMPIPVPANDKDFLPLSQKDIYKELRLRGYNYNGVFRGLYSCDTTATIGQIQWKNNYISFMDTMLQMQILHADTRGLYVPTSIDKVVVDAFKQKVLVQSLKENETIPVYVYKNIKRIQSGGIVITGLTASAIARRKPLGEPVLETYKFVPNINDNLTLDQSVRMMVQLAFENIQNIKIRTVEHLDDSSKEDQPLLSTLVQLVLGDLPLIQADINILTTKTMDELPGIIISDKKLVTESNCLLVIATNVIARTQLLQTAVNALVPEGFVIAREELDSDISSAELKNVAVVLEHRLDTEKIVLLKKTSDRKFQTAFDVSNAMENFDWLSTLQNTVKTDPNTIVYAQNDELSGVIGLVNCIRKEPGTDNVRCVFIMDKDAPKFDLNNEFYAGQLRKELAVNVLKDGVWGTYRHLLLPDEQNIEVEHAYVNVTVRGDLSSLRWLEGHLHSDMNLKANQTIVHVYYSALNFRDIMTATGRLAPEFVAKGRFEEDCVQGLEFSGRTQNGRKVMGMVARCGLSTMVIADPELFWECPEEFSLEDACTIPVTYGTVYYGLIIEAKIQPGQSILIHAGTGGVGQAAINIALHYGLKVYTTVGTQEKREFIKSTWPQIKDNQIGNSRDTSFEQMIMKETNGRGVDVVLNSLAEEKLLATVRCLAQGGKFLEIGKFDLSKNNPLTLQFLHKEASFHGIMLDHMFSASKPIKRVLVEGLAKAIKAGAVKPLTRCLFKEHEIEDAFRYMAAGKHIGKVLIKIREEEPEMVQPHKRLITAIRRHFSTPEGSYIITGGLGGFGLELTDWLILRGARNVVVTSRRGITTGYQALRIKIWRSYGVIVKVSTADITTFEGCQRLIKEAQELGPVEGVFNLAVVLKDAIFENQTKENFETSFGPKPIATKYLDEITRKTCPDLKLFVVFSSVSCGRGNAGQSNYGMGNSIMERICERRRNDGYPGLAIEWGAVGEVGLVAEMQDNHLELEIGGTLQQRVSSCLSVLDKFLKQSDPIVSSMVVAEKRATAGAGGNIIEAVVNILGIRDIKTVSFHSSLAELGMDSIMAVEIKQTLEREFEVFLTPQDIRSLTFARLQEIASERETMKGDQNEVTEQSVFGFNLMMRIVGSEDSSKEPMKVLPSLAPIDSKNKVVLIPGIEGVASVLEPLGNNLRVKPICMQLGFENDNEEIQAMANQLYNFVSDQFRDENKFILVGYSYGSAITLEVAALLEKEGKTGDIVLIDGSPVTLQHVVNQQITAENENQFQNNVISSILNIYMGGEYTYDIVAAFENCPTWDEKMNVAMEKAPKNTVHSEQHQRNVCNTIYHRLKAMANYESTTGALQSKIKLIKPKQHTIVWETEDFGLSAFSQQPIEIVYVDGNHVTILDNPECAEAINNMFEDNVIHFKETIINVNNTEVRDQPTLA